MIRNWINFRMALVVILMLISSGTCCQECQIVIMSVGRVDDDDYDHDHDGE